MMFQHQSIICNIHIRKIHPPEEKELLLENLRPINIKAPSDLSFEYYSD